MSDIVVIFILLAFSLQHVCSLMYTATVIAYATCVYFFFLTQNVSRQIN